MFQHCLLCRENETTDDRTDLCDACYDNAGRYLDTNIRLIVAIPFLLDACQTALAELHCPDGDDAECGAIAALKDALAMAKRA